MSLHPDIVDFLISCATGATCRRSRRSAAGFIPPRRHGDGPIILAGGYNGLATESEPGTVCPCPDGFRCGQVAVHAEARALSASLRILATHHPTYGANNVEIAHLKVDAHGQPTPSGAPSCGPCAAAMLDVSIEAVWLLHPIGGTPTWLAGTWNASYDQVSGWTRYPTEVFYDLTMRHLQMPKEVTWK